MMLRAFKRLLYFIGHYSLSVIASILAISLVIATLAPYINPNVFCLPNLLTLASPVWVACNLFLLFYWVARAKPSAYIPLFALLLAIGVHLLRFGNNGSHSSVRMTSIAQKIKVLSYNVNLFRLYSWAETPPTFAEISALIRRTDADIICLQEFTTSDVLFTDSAARKLLAPYSHIHYTQHQGNLHHGVALFSKYPIVNRGIIEFTESYNAAIYTDLHIGTDTIRVYSNHFQSFRLHRNNLNFLRTPSFTSSNNLLFQLTDIIRKLYRTLQRQADQALLVQQSVFSSPYPVLLCGDFNATPYTFTYATVSKKLHDTFLELHNGYGATFFTLYPPMRIDFILHTPDFYPLTFQVLHAPYSDHYPVLASFMLNNKNENK